MLDLISLAVSIIVLFTLLNNFDKFLYIVQGLCIGLLNFFTKLVDKLSPPN